MKHQCKNVLKALLMLGTLAQAAYTQVPEAQAPQPASVIVENVRIFNGTADQLSAPSNVLVVGNVIKQFPARPLPPRQAPR